MNEPIHYGQLKSEKTAEENDVCRRIAKEISQFGISERQRLFLIYTLALELEDASVMQELTACVKELTKSNIFLCSEDPTISSSILETTLWVDLLLVRSQRSQHNQKMNMKNMSKLLLFNSLMLHAS